MVGGAAGVMLYQQAMLQRLEKASFNAQYRALASHNALLLRCSYLLLYLGM